MKEGGRGIMTSECPHRHLRPAVSDNRVCPDRAVVAVWASSMVEPHTAMASVCDREQAKTRMTTVFVATPSLLNSSRNWKMGSMKLRGVFVGWGGMIGIGVIVGGFARKWVGRGLCVASSGSRGFAALALQ